MLASSILASAICVFAFTLAFSSSVVLARMMLVRMRLRLDRDEEVLARLCDSVHEDFISVWPLSHKCLLLVIFCEALLRDFVVEERGVSGGVGGGASGVSSFDFSRLNSADAVIVVVDGGLKDIVEEAFDLAIGIAFKVEYVGLGIETNFKFLTRGCLCEC
eukprot:TRINITY_DN30754_c0_g1_i1.p3 TRINITY_DN30754_c0_g1~~TRINITY_DN30754_c0_g1_i1.p3  ORF type:complete len:161 (-),score=0.44 TRINITY_DN30754_c0_g1_i1:308-790(-)